MQTSIFQTENGKKYLFPFVIIASLFFLSGYTNALLDVLNKYFQVVSHISKSESGLVQFSLYSGYFVMAIPAGLFIYKFGYNKSLIFGLLILISGTLLFVLGAIAKSYYIFLFALFVIACGFSFFEINANPYATFLGNKHAASRRINLAQAFNGLGWIFGSFLGGIIIFNNSTQEYHFNNLPIPFSILSAGVLLILILILKKPLPELSEINRDNKEKSENLSVDEQRPFFKHPHFVFAILAQFFYVAGQTGVNSFFINYVTEANSSISDKSVSLMLAFGGMGLFVAGRFWVIYFLKSLIPGMTDTEENIQAIGKFLSECNDGSIRKWEFCTSNSLYC